MTKTKDQQINEIMDNFDFNKVAKVMDFLDWKWYLKEYRVPAEPEIRKKVRQHLTKAFEYGQGQGRKYTLCTGGFVCSYDPEYSELSLTFELDGWVSYPIEESEPF